MIYCDFERHFGWAYIHLEGEAAYKKRKKTYLFTYKENIKMSFPDNDTHIYSPHKTLKTLT